MWLFEFVVGRWTLGDVTIPAQVIEYDQNFPPGALANQI
jgi:hypothetical protein